MEYFLPDSQEKYRGIFTPLKDQLPGIFSSLPPAQLIAVKGNVAQYRVKREQVWEGVPRLVTYYLWFRRDTDGLWKLDEF